MDEDIKDLLALMEKQNGGPMVFKTYCRLLGYADGTPVNLGGMLYVINGKLIFEDFENENPGMMGLLTSRSKKKKYEKFKTFRMVEHITGMHTVRASQAKRLIDGHMTAVHLPEASALERIIAQTVLEISFSDAPAWYVELLNNKDFIDFVEGYNESIQGV